MVPELEVLVTCINFFLPIFPFNAILMPRAEGTINCIMKAALRQLPKGKSHGYSDPSQRNTVCQDAAGFQGCEDGGELQ